MRKQSLDSIETDAEAITALRLIYMHRDGFRKQDDKVCKEAAFEAIELAKSNHADDDVMWQKLASFLYMPAAYILEISGEEYYDKLLDVLIEVRPSVAVMAFVLDGFTLDTANTAFALGMEPKLKKDNPFTEGLR